MNIDKLVETSYRKNKEESENIIEEVMRLLFSEQKLNSPVKATFDWSMIPDIPISEIGWSDVSTTKEGSQVLGPQRALLQQYLDNIGSPDGTFEEQIASLQEFYGHNGPKAIIGNSTSPTEAIGKLISYLVFYKTLTKVVTNFNAASAGFSFESFLAVLLNGRQIDANTGTIADFLTGDGIPVSLKLYTKLKVGGSWNDLVMDIVEPKFSHPWKGKGGSQGNAMRYVSGIKRLSGERLKQYGKIELYQFDITLDNIVDIMLTSVKPNVVAMPRSLIVSGEDLAATLPDREQPPSLEALTAQFRKNLNELVPEIVEGSKLYDLFDQWGIDPASKLDQAIKEWPYKEEVDRTGFYDNWQGLAFTKIKSAKPLVELLKKTFLNLDGKVPPYGFATPFNAYIKQLAEAMKIAHNAIAGAYAAKEINSARAAAVADSDWIQLNRRAGKGINRATSAEEVITDAAAIKKYYDGLDVEGKKRALLNTYGMLGTTERQWDLNDKQATSPDAPVYSKKLGELQIGGALVEAMVEQVTGLLNDEVFAVFSLLKELSDNLNSFFAGGLKDDEKASKAITNAGDIQTRTADVSSGG